MNILCKTPIKYFIDYSCWKGKNTIREHIGKGCYRFIMSGNMNEFRGLP